ncbi:hypothetical protein GDO81_010595 [Engystomops pustulosus]|uniref:Uncharacterized protein n=1 Tax=Engystomops pustulosus TaxID=76066 RepID=A0AAV7C177_ENGPU|nr:hypothetical protein GDO81_010595 [Engystomops pustulosus]
MINSIENFQELFFLLNTTFSLNDVISCDRKYLLLMVVMWSLGQCTSINAQWLDSHMTCCDNGRTSCQGCRSGCYVYRRSEDTTLANN